MTPWKMLGVQSFGYFMGPCLAPQNRVFGDIGLALLNAAAVTVGVSADVTDGLIDSGSTLWVGGLFGGGLAGSICDTFGPSCEGELLSLGVWDNHQRGRPTSSSSGGCGSRCGNAYVHKCRDCKLTVTGSSSCKLCGDSKYDWSELVLLCG